jgi:hypothetical protein
VEVTKLPAKNVSGAGFPRYIGKGIGGKEFSPLCTVGTYMEASI